MEVWVKNNKRHFVHIITFSHLVNVSRGATLKKKHKQRMDCTGLKLPRKEKPNKALSLSVVQGFTDLLLVLRLTMFALHVQAQKRLFITVTYNRSGTSLSKSMWGFSQIGHCGQKPGSHKRGYPYSSTLR